MSNDGVLGRAELEQAFTALGERLMRRGMVADLRVLATIIGLSTVDAALRVCDRFFPGEPLPPRSQAMLEDIFAAD